MGRREWTLPLLLLAFITAALGGGLALVSDTALPFSTYFPEGPWRWLGYSCLAMVGCAMLLTVTEALGRRDRATHVVDYDGSVDKPLAESLGEFSDVATRILADESPDIVRLVDETLRVAMSVRASDIHVTQGASDAALTLRVDGVLHQALRLPNAAAERVVSRVKVLAKLELSQMRPQDGAMQRHLGLVTIHTRVSVLPAHFGERLVLRLVRGNEAVTPLADLGFDPAVHDALSQILQRNHGILYVSGPVGSGKTTTLYSALGEIHRTRGSTISLMSLEDPIEHQVPFVTQTQINTRTGLGFAAGLRSLLRQDPGAIMIGEVRDAETAEIVVQSGLTGHLILTTLHVDSALGTFARLIDMGIKPMLVADSCAGAMAQRLVRRLCQYCKKPHEPTSDELKRLESLELDCQKGELFAPTGCEACDQQGYTGRIAIAELLTMNATLRKAVSDGLPSADFKRLAAQHGWQPLSQSALRLACRGETSLAEVLRVAP